MHRLTMLAAVVAIAVLVAATATGLTAPARHGRVGWAAAAAGALALLGTAARLATGAARVRAAAPDGRRGDDLRVAADRSTGRMRRPLLAAGLVLALAVATGPFAGRGEVARGAHFVASLVALGFVPLVLLLGVVAVAGQARVVARAEATAGAGAARSTP